MMLKEVRLEVSKSGNNNGARSIWMRLSGCDEAHLVGIVRPGDDVEACLANARMAIISTAAAYRASLDTANVEVGEAFFRLRQSFTEGV